MDGRLELSEIRNKSVFDAVNNWITDYCNQLGNIEKPQKGVVFEVRQGYKSKDSKRQNADIDNATVAWAYSYLPIFAIFYSQIDADVIRRYRNNRCGILIGTNNGDCLSSLYRFSQDILGYNLADFFQRNTELIKQEINEVLEVLLSTK